MVMCREEFLVYEAENEKFRLRVFYDDHPENPREWDNLGTMVCSHRRYDLGDEQAKNTELYSSWEEWLENEVLEPNGGEDEVVVLPLYLYDHSGITMNTSGFSCPWDSGQVGWIYCTKKRFREETGYTEDELFSTDQHREPKVREHVKVKGRDAGPCEWGQVTEIQDGMVTVDFDYCRSSVRKPENVVTVPLSEIEEVMANRAVEMLVEEVETYDDYLTGRVYGFVLEEKKLGCDAKECPACGHVEPCDSNSDIEYEQTDSCWGFYGDWAKQGIQEHLDPEAHDLLEGFRG
jgi:hypothetical protein